MYNAYLVVWLYGYEAYKSIKTQNNDTDAQGLKA